MSEWEEYCDSNGWNIGSAADYETFLDSLEGEPRSSGAIRSLPTTEITSTVEQDELIGALLEGVCNNGIEVRVERHVLLRDHGVVNLGIFDDWLDEPMPNYYLRSNAYDFDVSITFVIDTLRTIGIPLLSDCGDWLAWDAQEQRLKCYPPPAGYFWSQASEERPESSLDERELQLVQLLHRAALSTDHGKKPLLMQHEFLYDAMQKREVEYEDPRRIMNKDIGRYVLAFYNATGEIASIPLEQAAKLEYPIHTRNSVYIWRDGDLVPLFNNAKLLVGAFLIAVNHNPNEFQWFLARERGTVFHSAVERIEAPKEPGDTQQSAFFVRSSDSSRKTYVTWEKMTALQVASDITEESFDLGTVYLTIGGHPLDVELVTTPKLYQHALKTLSRFGYEVSYNLTNGVYVKKNPE